MSIITMLRNKPWHSLVLALIVVLSTFSVAGGTYCLTYAIDALKDARYREFFVLLSVGGVVMLAGYLLQAPAQYCYASIVQQYFHVLRTNFAARQYDAATPMSVSTAQNRLTNDLAMLLSDKLMPTYQIATSLLSVAVSAYALISFHWSLVVFSVAIAGFMMAPPVLFGSVLQKAMLAVSRANKAYLHTIDKWFGGLEELRRYDAREQFEDVMGKSARRLEHSKVHNMLVRLAVNSVSTFWNVVAQMLLILLAGYLYSRGLVTFGVIVSAGSFSSEVFNGILTIADSYGQVHSSKTLNDEVAATMSAPTPQELQAAQGSTQASHVLAQTSAQTPAQTQPQAQSIAIDAQGLSVQFDGGEALNYPDFHVQAGEKVLLTGDSGSGKSTLLKMLAGQLTPSSGTIAYFDTEHQPVALESSGVGYVPQKAVMFPASIEHNITMFNASLASAVPEAVARMEFKNDIAKFPQGLNTAVDCDTPNLSGGQEQKVVLARAIIHAKPLILVDEGTSAVDSDATYHMVKELLNTPATVIFIAHNFNSRVSSLFTREIHLGK